MLCFSNSILFPEKLLEKAGVFGNYDGISVHALIVRVLYRLRGEQTLKVGAIRTHWDSISSSEIPNLDRSRREERILRYTLIKRLPVVHVGEPINLKYARYRTELDKLVGGIIVHEQLPVLH